VIPVDIYIDKRRMGGAYLDVGWLSETVSRASTSSDPVVRPRDCDHAETADGWAYTEYWNEHWPIRVCRTCRAILEGRCPGPKAPDRKSWEMDTEDVILAKWSKQWPRYGRPRAKRPPASVEWPPQTRPKERLENDSEAA